MVGGIPYRMTENSKGPYDAILSSHSTKSSSNINRNLTLMGTQKALQYFKEHFPCKTSSIYFFAQMNCFAFQSYVPGHRYVQEI